MKIALINEYFPPFAPGGAEWSTLHLGQALVKAGHEVTIITPNYGTAAREDLAGLEVVRFPYPARLAGRRTLPVRWLGSPFFYLWSAFFMWYYGRRAGFDVLHAQNKYTLPGAWLASRVLGVPVIVTLRDTLTICPFGRCLMRYDQLPEGCGHGHLWHLCQEAHIADYIRPRGRLGRLKARLTTTYMGWDLALRRWVLNRVDGVIAVSQGILSLYQQAQLGKQLHTEVIYNIPPDEQAVPSASSATLRARYHLKSGPIVLYVGKFSPGKGTLDLVAAATQVQEHMPDVQFVFVGDTTLPRNGTAPAVTLLGRIPNEDVLQLYQVADLVVVPSVWPEPLSRVLLEAMAAGRAVIGTRVGGTPELIDDGVNGLLVPRSSPPALAEAILALLQDPAHRHEMGQAGRGMIQARFHPQHTIAQLLAFYRRVAAGPR